MKISFDKIKRLCVQLSSRNGGVDVCENSLESLRVLRAQLEPAHCNIHQHQHHYQQQQQHHLQHHTFQCEQDQLHIQRRELFGKPPCEQSDCQY